MCMYETVVYFSDTTAIPVKRCCIPRREDCVSNRGPIHIDTIGQELLVSKFFVFIMINMCIYKVDSSFLMIEFTRA